MQAIHHPAGHIACCSTFNKVGYVVYQNIWLIIFLKKLSASKNPAEIGSTVSEIIRTKQKDRQTTIYYIKKKWK